ncbi:MAG: hypothetical protein WBI41_11660, partial [Azovibrio sp.]
LAGHPRVRHLRQQGMILAFDVDSSDPAFSRRFYRAALAQEALVRPMGNTVYVMPPYIVSPEEIAHLAQAVAGALDAALENGEATDPPGDLARNSKRYLKAAIAAKHPGRTSL